MRAGGARRTGRQLAKLSTLVLGAPLVTLPFGPVGQPKRLRWHMGRREWLGQKTKKEEKEKEKEKEEKEKGPSGPDSIAGRAR